MRLDDRSKELAQSLCTRLAEMLRVADSAYRRNTINCQVRREHHCGALLKRIGRGRIFGAGWAPPPGACTPWMIAIRSR
jgi:hypothetical protein